MSLRRELGVVLLVVILGTYWLVCAVAVADNLADHPTPTTWYSGPGDLTEVHP